MFDERNERRGEDIVGLDVHDVLVENRCADNIHRDRESLHNWIGVADLKTDFTDIGVIADLLGGNFIQAQWSKHELNRC